MKSEKLKVTFLLLSTFYTVEVKFTLYFISFTFLIYTMLQKQCHIAGQEIGKLYIALY